MGLPVPKNPHKRVNLICYDFLRSIGFFNKDGGPNDQIGLEIVNEMSRQLDWKARRSDEQLCLAAVTIVVLRHIGKCSLPGPLLFDTVRFYASHMLGQLRKHGLKNLHRLLRKKQSSCFVYLCLRDREADQGGLCAIMRTLQARINQHGE